MQLLTVLVSYRGVMGIL